MKGMFHNVILCLKLFLLCISAIRTFCLCNSGRNICVVVLGDNFSFLHLVNEIRNALEESCSRLNSYMYINIKLHNYY